MAYINKDGSYTLTCSCGFNENGKQIRKTKTWHPPEGMSPKKAAREVIQVEDDFRQEVLSEMKNEAEYTFNEVAQKWLELVAFENKLKTSTINRYADTVKCLNKELSRTPYSDVKTLKTKYEKLKNDNEKVYYSQLPINYLSAQVLQNIIIKFGQNGKSTKTQKLCKTVLIAIFHYANNTLELGLKNIAENIVCSASVPKESRYLTQDEAKTFFQLLEKEPLKYQVFFNIALFTGFRKGEILGLEWDDVDFNNNTLKVSKNLQWTKEKGHYYTTPKTLHSNRIIEVDEKVINILKEYKNHQIKEAEIWGDQWIVSDRIFTSENGGFPGDDTYRHWLNKFCKRNGIVPFTVHSCRHTFASILIDRGLDILEVSRALGHSQTTTTLNIYSHLIDNNFSKVASNISEAYGLKKAE